MMSPKESLIYYFCYGSNLLIQRMKINNKSATKFSNGLLPGYQLSFSGNSTVWKGATANIVPNPKASPGVYGVVYTLDTDDICNLDRQEIGYDPIDVSVKLYNNNNRSVLCRTYVQKSSYSQPTDGIPSKLYKEIIIRGALENGLPSDYIENVIKTFPDNGIVDCGPSGLDRKDFGIIS